MAQHATIWRLLARAGVSASIALLAVAPHAQGASNNAGRAQVIIVLPLTITLDSNPNWGTVMAPASGSATYTLDTSTGTTTLTSGGGFAFSDGAAGVYTVTGGPIVPISYSVAIGAFSGSGVTVVAAYINGTSSSGTVLMSLGGSATLNVGGVISVDSTAANGTQTATVTVNVNYL